MLRLKPEIRQNYFEPVKINFRKPMFVKTGADQFDWPHI